MRTYPTKITDATCQFLRSNAERFVGHLRLEPETAKDCVAEFLAKGAQIREKTPEATRPLLLVSGRNAVWDFLRIFQRQIKRETLALPETISTTTLSTLSTGSSPEMLFQQHNIQEIVQEAVMKLSPAQQQVWHLHVREGMSFGQISIEIGKKENAVRQMFFNARQQMQKNLIRQGWNETILREYVAEAARQL